MSTLQERIQPALEARQSSLEQAALLPTEVAIPSNATSIPRSCGVLSDKELDLTENYDATALVELLASQKVSAVTLLTAFRKRATVAHQCTNCLIELIPDAVNDAVACDSHLAKTGQALGPLHGLPVSIKGLLAVSGRRTNIGLAAWADHISDDDAHLVKCLKQLGAVVFARTNVPQSLMQLETSNNIYGATVNPLNRNLTAGGSTGGEAALMAMKGTPLGIGGDIGGSIRVPAALNGLYGLLPTPGRIGGEGVKIPSPGSDSIAGTLGPFGRSLRDLELFCNAYSSTNPWIRDHTIIPCGILDPALGRAFDPDQPLRVGFMLDDGVVSPLPPVRRVLETVKTKLEGGRSVQVKNYLPWDHAKAWRVISALYFEDGGDDIRQICLEGSEPLEPLTQWILEECQANTSSGSSLQTRKMARDAFKDAYGAHWNKAGIDVLIAPVTPSTAPPLATSKYWGYTAVWNLLSYPAVVLPAASLMGESNAASVLEEDSYEPKNDIEAHIYNNYKASTSEGMPVGIQIVAPRLHESFLMKAAHVIESALTTG